MKCIISSISFIFFTSLLFAQKIDSLNTAKNAIWCNAQEKEMIYELNCLRSNPKSYIKYIQPLYDVAKENLTKEGKGSKNYSISYVTTYPNNKPLVRIDTTWHYSNEEEEKALALLLKELNELNPLQILKPDAGIYKAATKHSKDQIAHNWELLHTGSDGRDPWDRIIKFSPKMKTGNENIAGATQLQSPRDFVIQLLIDSGIPGYGHRYNMLNPIWTHVACKQNFSKKYGGMAYWIQNFGQIK